MAGRSILAWRLSRARVRCESWMSSLGRSLRFSSFGASGTAVLSPRIARRVAVMAPRRVEDLCYSESSRDVRLSIGSRNFALRSVQLENFDELDDAFEKCYT